jgi:transposase
MPKARLVLTALLVDRQTPAEVAARYGVHRSWVYKLKARYDADGEAAFEPRSRRPKASPTATPPATVTLITELRGKLTTAGLDAGPDTIAWHLAHHHRTTVSASTISRTLSRAGLVTPTPKKRPKSSYHRFAATLPDETWQADFTHYRLTHPNGTPGPDAEVLTWLDDHSRYALDVTAHQGRDRPDRARPLPGRGGPLRHSGLDVDRQRDGLHHAPCWPQGRPQRPRGRATTPWRGPEERPPQPPHHLPARSNASNRPSRSGSPPNPSSPAPSRSCRPCSTRSPTSTTTAGRTGPCRTGPPRDRLRHPPQGPTHRQPRRRHPRPGPARPHRRQRLRHPARRRPAAPPRDRPNPRPNPRRPARLRPARPRGQRRHRGAAPRAGPRPHQGLPAHRSTQRPNPKTTSPNPRPRVRTVADLLRDHTGAPGGIRTPDPRIRSADRPVRWVPPGPSPQLRSVPRPAGPVQSRVVVASGMTKGMTARHHRGEDGAAAAAAAIGMSRPSRQGVRPRRVEVGLWLLPGDG